MKASDLKPGQFFECDEVRCHLPERPRRRLLWTGSELGAICIDGCSYPRAAHSCTVELFQGWDDEPAPPKLQLREGGYYQRRDGKVVGGFTRDSQVPDYPWWDNENALTYTNDGQYCIGDPDDLDLLTEVPPPHFRHATPEEVAGAKADALLASKPLSYQPDADGWIEWSGGECPVDTSKLWDVRMRSGAEYLNQSVRGLCWSYTQDSAFDCDIVAYRPITPKPTHWTIIDGVEVRA